MRLRRASRFLLGLSCLALPAAAAGRAGEPPRPGVGAPADASRPVVTGRLGNGVRYAILPRRGGAPGVALLMRIEGGFLAERRPGERGLAHLIEHLAFHSPTRTAPDQRERFREVGMPLTLPEPAGGTTTWRESDYFVVSRTAAPADLDALLGLYREVAGELTLRADAVDEQRAEVMREMADRRPGNDAYARYVSAVAPGSPTDVIDAQNSDDVPTAGVETIRALYHRLYRPENTVLVLVGDVDPHRMEALVERRFGDWRGVGPAPGRVAVPTFRADRVAPVSHAASPDGRRTAGLTVVMPVPPAPPSRERQARATLMDMLATRAATDRMALSQGGFPPGKYGVFIENGEQGHRLFNMWDNFAPGRWREAVAGLKRLSCDLAATGFTQAGWAAAKRSLLAELERRAAADRPAIELARELADALTAGREPIPPGDLLRRARAWLPTLDARTGAGWWRRQWRAGPEHLRVEAPELAQVADPDAAIRAAADGAVGAGCAVRRR